MPGGGDPEKKNWKIKNGIDIIRDWERTEYKEKWERQEL